MDSSCSNDTVGASLLASTAWEPIHDGILEEARLELVKKLICNEKHHLNEDHFKDIASMSEGYSGADIRNLCSEASLGPIRSIDINLIEQIQAAEVRPLMMNDFEKAFSRVKSSVSSKDLEQYVAWDKTYGSGSGT